jgi:hypothetical protein
MAYITPNTVTGSDVLTAALWNTQIRDNFEAVTKPAFVSVRRSSNISSYASGTPISWSTTDGTPTAGMWSASQPTRLTAPQTGLYLLTSAINFQTKAGGTDCVLRVDKNNTNTIALSRNPLMYQHPGGTSTGFAAVIPDFANVSNISMVLTLNASDYIALSMIISGAFSNTTAEPVTIRGGSLPTNTIIFGSGQQLNNMPSVASLTFLGRTA